MTDQPISDDPMAEVLKRQSDRMLASMSVDRRGWTPAQWADDAERLMQEPDGAITSLLNGHVLHLIGERERLQQRVAELEGLLRTLPIERMCKPECLHQRQRGTNEAHDSLCPVSVVLAAISQEPTK